MVLSPLLSINPKEDSIMIKVSISGCFISKRVAAVYLQFKEAINNNVKAYYQTNDMREFTMYVNDNKTSEKYYVCKPFQVIHPDDIYAPKKLIKEIINLAINYPYNKYDWTLSCFLSNSEIEELIEAYNNDPSNTYTYTLSDYSDRVYCLKKRNI